MYLIGWIARQISDMPENTNFFAAHIFRIEFYIVNELLM